MYLTISVSFNIGPVWISKIFTGFLNLFSILWIAPVGIKTDSIKSIYDCVIQEAMTYKFGGGCGHDLSILRPSGDQIVGTGGNSCGPVGFMNLFSENTNTIAQHGRRGANMQTLRVDHPDIVKFIESKTNQ